MIDFLDFSEVIENHFTPVRSEAGLEVSMSFPQRCDHSDFVTSLKE
jgi:hypothetical protein